MTLYLSEEFERSWKGADPFQQLQQVDGKIYREVKGRKTQQFSLNGKSYFVKLHMGVGWIEIVKNLLQLRSPVLGAGNEWRAIDKLHELGVDTMKTVAYGQRGWNPARRQSFIVTEELTDTVSLEDFCKNWPTAPPTFIQKRRLIEKIAQISRVLHSNGVCHRDFYLCHFLLHHREAFAVTVPRLSLIDLHRALIKNKLAIRWVIKDIAGLYYSAMNIGLTRQDLFRFIKYYDDSTLRQSLIQRRKFWIAVRERAMQMHEKLGHSS